MEVLYLKIIEDVVNYRKQVQPFFDGIAGLNKKQTKKGRKFLDSKEAKIERIKKCRYLTKNRKKYKQSPAEKRISEFLIKQGIKFIIEYYSPDLYNDRTNSLLYFDFYLPKYKEVIEYDGVHHFKPTNGEDKYKEQRYKDFRKDKYCKDKKINMLRISCYDKRNIEDILIEFFDNYIKIIT